MRLTTTTRTDCEQILIKKPYLSPWLKMLKRLKQLLRIYFDICIKITDCSLRNEFVTEYYPVYDCTQPTNS